MDSILIFLKNLILVKCVLMASSITPSSLRSSGPLELVHSDLCGKMNGKSESEAEYFLSFIDDRTRCVGIHFASQGPGIRKNFESGKLWSRILLKENSKLSVLITEDNLRLQNLKHT